MITGILSEVKAVTDYSTVKTMSVEDAKAQGLFITNRQRRRTMLTWQL